MWEREEKMGKGEITIQEYTVKTLRLNYKLPIRIVFIVEP